MGNKSDKRKVSSSVSVPQAVRDVMIASMNKGQFPLAICGLIVLVLIGKMPSEDVSKLVFLIIDPLQRWYFFGYGLSFTLSLGWVFHSKWQRRVFTDEIARLSDERNNIQKIQLGEKVRSSA